MYLDQFLEVALEQIADGIKEFNKENPGYLAQMPKRISFDLAVIDFQGVVHVVDSSLPTATDEQTSRLKIEIDVFEFLNRERQ